MCLYIHRARLFSIYGGSSVHHYLDIISTPYTPSRRTRTNLLGRSRTISWQWMKLGPVNIKRIEYLESWICTGLVAGWRQELIKRVIQLLYRLEEEGIQGHQDGEFKDDNSAEHHVKTGDGAYVMHIHSFVHSLLIPLPEYQLRVAIQLPPCAPSLQPMITVSNS